MPIRFFKKLVLTVLSGLVLLPMLSFGAETRRQQYILGDNTERIFIEGIRPMGMGGAFTAVANDENALFYNPAGLDRIKYWRFTFPHTLLGSDIQSWDNLIYLLGQYTALQTLSGGNLTPEQEADLADVIDRISNTRIHAMMQSSLRYIQPNFGWGTYLYTDAMVETGAILLPEASWNLKGGLIQNIAMGWGWDIPEFGYFAFGVALKALVGVQSLEEDKSALDIDSFPMEMKLGGGFDLGFLYQPIDEISFALVAADLYSQISGDVLPPNLKLGFAYQPWWLNYEDLEAIFALDVVELNWQGDNEFKNNKANAALINFSKMRVGVEFLLSGLIALRGGMYQGYPTAGISLVTGFINIDWAYYAKELGTYPGQNPEWNHRLSIDWHDGSGVAPTPTPTSTITPTFTPTATVTATPTKRPTPQPTLSGRVPKLRGTFVGFKGKVGIVPKLPDDMGEVTSYKLKITNRRGTVLKSFKGKGFPKKSFTWNGKYRGKRVSSKKHYPWSMTMQTDEGTKTVQGTLVIVDTIPKLYTSKSYEVYPDKVYFSIKKPLGNVKSWKLDIIDAANNVIRSYRTQEKLFKAFAWDAKDEDEMVVANNATYRYELNIVDQNGHEILINDRIRPVKGKVYPNENRTTAQIGGILFSTGKAYLTAEMFDKVIKCAYIIQDEPNSQVSIEGHTDSTGKKKTNMRLSLVRSESVRRFLIDQQRVPDYQLAIKGWGPTRPIATNRTKAGRKKNRRVEVIMRIPQQ